MIIFTSSLQDNVQLSLTTTLKHNGRIRHLLQHAQCNKLGPSLKNSIVSLSLSLNFLIIFSYENTISVIRKSHMLHVD